METKNLSEMNFNITNKSSFRLLGLETSLAEKVLFNIFRFFAGWIKKEKNVEFKVLLSFT